MSAPTTATATESSEQYKFQGWAALDPGSVQGNLKFIEYEPKEFADDDIDIKVQYCGVCATDIHTLSEQWGELGDKYPQVVGHEIVGIVTRVGSAVENGIQVGDVVGVGAQCDSCRACERCQDHAENYCDAGVIQTYNDHFRRTSPGTKTYGGYANYWRGPSHFAFKIPRTVDPAGAAPMLCGGATVFAPLQQHGAGTTAKDVGVIGIGGLGHFAVLFAKAMGANVTALSHSAGKEKDARELGADKVLVTGDDVSSAVAPHKRSLDLLICTSDDPKMQLDAYMSLLRPKGTLIMLSVPDAAALPPISPWTIIPNGLHIGGSLIASPQTMRAMLDFAGAHNDTIKPWITKWSMNKVNEALPAMMAGKARYRYVLVNEENGGKL